MALSLTCSAFEAEARIPKKHTCDGKNVSPPFDWSGAPAETKSFALVCTDPDAPTGVFHHWAVYDIPADCKALAEGFNTEQQAADIRQAVNDFQKAGYGGPCPPPGHGLHHYHFRLTALREPRLHVSPSPTCREIVEAAALQTIEAVDLVGVYER